MYVESGGRISPSANHSYIASSAIPTEATAHRWHLSIHIRLQNSYTVLITGIAMPNEEFLTQIFIMQVRAAPRGFLTSIGFWN